MEDLFVYLQKLVHPIPEIRHRSICALLHKFECGLLSVNALADDSILVPNLIQSLGLGPKDNVKELLQLLFIILKKRQWRDQFTSLFGLQYLRSLRLTAPDNVLPLISQILQLTGLTGAQSQEILIEPYAKIAEKVSSSASSLFDTNFSKPELHPVHFTGRSTQSDGEISGFGDSSVQDMTQTNSSKSIIDNSFMQIPEESSSIYAAEECTSFRFNTFPWIALADSDRRVLQSLLHSLGSDDQGLVFASLQFLDAVVTKDFPAEVFLQRPEVLQTVLKWAHEKNKAGWRVQGPALLCLMTLTKGLSKRVKQMSDPHFRTRKEQNMTPCASGNETAKSVTIEGSCCPKRASYICGKQDKEEARDLDNFAKDLGNRTIHEEDDGDEFILLSLSQMTLEAFCVRVMRVILPSLTSPRASLQTTSFQLFVATLDLLKLCFEEENKEVTLINENIREVITNISHLIIVSYESLKLTDSKIDIESQTLTVYGLVLIMCRIMCNFVPTHSSRQVLSPECKEALLFALCDGGFYLAWPVQHRALLSYLSEIDPSCAIQVNALTWAGELLQLTRAFLTTPSSKLDQFLPLASRILSLGWIHHSGMLIRKLVKGLSKQFSEFNVEFMTEGEDLLLSVLTFGQNEIRLAGYETILEVVSDSVSVSQVADTSLRRSSEVLIFLTPRIMKQMMLGGLTDMMPELVSMCEEILLTLLKGKHLMRLDVWSSALSSWRICFPFLQMLTDYQTPLGKAVGRLNKSLLMEDSFSAIQLIQHHFRHLFSTVAEVRRSSLSWILQRLATGAHNFLPVLTDCSCDRQKDAFILTRPVTIFMGHVVGSLENGRLINLVEMIQSSNVDGMVRRSAWSQLAFVMEDVRVHSPFLRLCSIQYLTVSYISLLRREGSVSGTVDCIPGITLVIRHLATYSSQIRDILANDEEFLLCLVRASLLFYANESVRFNLACLAMFLLYAEFIVFPEVDSCVKQKSIGLPKLLYSHAQIPFDCRTYEWMGDISPPEEIKALLRLLETSRGDSAFEFLKSVWNSACADGIANITDSTMEEAAKFLPMLQMGKRELFLLSCSLLSATVENQLYAILNATAHHTVKTAVNHLGFCILFQQLGGKSQAEESLLGDLWVNSLSRFFSNEPNSSADEQLLYHVVCIVSLALKVYGSTVQNHMPPLLALLLGELSNRKSAIMCAWIIAASLGSALECLAEATSVGNPGEEILVQLVVSLIRCVSTFDIGRGRAHNSLMGRMVTLRASFTLVNVMSHQDLSLYLEDDECSDLSWLASLFVYRDLQVTCAGFMVAASLASSSTGFALLEKGFQEIMGGIWGIALSYLLSSDRSCLERTAAAQLLLNLSCKPPSVSRPWNSPVVTDTLTKHTVQGVEALMVLLQHCDFYTGMRSVLGGCFFGARGTSHAHSAAKGVWDLSNTVMSLSVAADSRLDSNESESNVPPVVSLPLMEISLKLMTNFLLLDPSQMILQLSSHHFALLLVRQLRLLIPHVNSCPGSLGVVKSSFIFLASVLKHDPGVAPFVVRDGGLLHLTLETWMLEMKDVVLDTATLEVLSVLVQHGSWESIGALDWLVLSAKGILSPLVSVFHSDTSCDLVMAAAIFLADLMSEVLKAEARGVRDGRVSLTVVFDSEIDLLNEESVCPGWEICRHIVQVLSHMMNDKDDPNSVKKNLTLQLSECLKLLFLTSKSAKEAALHLGPLFVPWLLAPLEQLVHKLQSGFAHSKTNLKKEFDEDITCVIQHLDIANNWATGMGQWTIESANIIMPHLHPLWGSACSTPVLMASLLGYLCTASQHLEVCQLLTCTSIYPSVSLSKTRTSKPLLASVNDSVILSLTRESNRLIRSGQSHLGPAQRQMALSLLVNCARVPKCILVLGKNDLINAIMIWLEMKTCCCKKNLATTTIVIKLLAMMTAHREPQMTVCKYNGWLLVLQESLSYDVIRQDLMVVVVNLCSNHHSSRVILSTDEMVKEILNILSHEDNSDIIHLAVVAIWALVANNQKGQAVLKQYPVIPLLLNVAENRSPSTDICTKVLQILTQ